MWGQDLAIGLVKPYAARAQEIIHEYDERGVRISTPRRTPRNRARGPRARRRVDVVSGAPGHSPRPETGTLPPLRAEYEALAAAGSGEVPAPVPRERSLGRPEGAALYPADQGSSEPRGAGGGAAPAAAAEAGAGASAGRGGSVAPGGAAQEGALADGAPQGGPGASHGAVLAAARGPPNGAPPGFGDSSTGAPASPFLASPQLAAAAASAGAVALDAAGGSGIGAAARGAPPGGASGAVGEGQPGAGAEGGGGAAQAASRWHTPAAWAAQARPWRQQPHLVAAYSC